jgi:hypothetical protein
MNDELFSLPRSSFIIHHCFSEIPAAIRVSAIAINLYRAARAFT